MDSVDLQVLRSACNWIDDGRRVVLATVIRTWGSSPRPIGALAAVRDDGLVAGSVSGGCIEDDLIERMRAGHLVGERPATTKYGVSGDEAQRFGLPCGGTLELVLEPLSRDSAIGELLERVGRHELVRRRLDMATGRVELSAATPGEQLGFDGRALVSVHGPRWRLVIIGAGQLSGFLAQMAQGLDYQVTICDPRPEYTAGWDVPGAEVRHGMPDDVVQDLQPDGHTAVVTLTHDPKLDDLALMEALKSPAFYVGAIGSTRNNEARRQRLREFDLTPDDIARLHGPVGLKLGAKTPPEIAVAIIAQMTAVRNGVIVPDYIEPPKATVEGCVLS